MISTKGRQEIRRLISSDLVNDWSEIDRTLKNVVRMLLSQRPDLVRLYFLPAVWARIVALERKQAAAVILAALKAAVVAENGAPDVADPAQACFYLTTRVPAYVEKARMWCRQHPERCPRGWHRKPPPLPLALDDGGSDPC